MDIFELGLDKWLRKPAIISDPQAQDLSGLVSGTSGLSTGGGSVMTGTTSPSSTNPNTVGSGEMGSILAYAKKNFADTTEGWIQGKDTDNVYKWLIGGSSSSIDWGVTTPSTLTIKGSVTAGEISIGTSPNWFRVDSSGNTWWGSALFATAPASVSPTGVCKFESGTIGGWALGTTTISSANITIDSANQRIRSSNYAEGLSGFTLEPNLLETGNIVARGLIRTSVFQKDSISAVNGSFLVNTSADILEQDMSALDASPMYTKGDASFASGDVLRIKDGIDDEWMSITTGVSVADSYSEINQSAYIGMYSGITISRGQAFAGADGVLDSCKFYLFKTGSPTGIMVAKIYALTGTFGSTATPAGSALAVSNPVDVTILLEDVPNYQLITYTFSDANRITLETGTNYLVCLEYLGGDGANRVEQLVDNTAHSHPGNYAYTTNLINWFAGTSFDVIFYVYIISDGYTLTRDLAGSYTADNNPEWKKGATIVNYGQTNDGFIELITNTVNSPYLRIASHSGAPWSSLTEKVRLGKLDGITDPLFGTLSGYGLWTDNIFLTGAINASQGQIGGFEIGSDYIRDVDEIVGITTSTDTSPTLELLPGTGSDDATVGIQAWTSPENITTEAFSSIAGIKPPGIPPPAGLPLDEKVRVIKSDGSIGTTDMSSATGWTSSLIEVTYGGETELWGETWSVSDVNSSNFGLALQVDWDGLQTHYLKATNFNFNIPTGTTITGIKFIIKRQLGSPSGPMGPMYTVVYSIKCTLYIDQPIRFWAGDTYANRGIAPFRVYQNGDVVMGNVEASNLVLYDVIVDSTGKGDYEDIQSALDSGAKSIFVRNGGYEISSSITITSSDINIVGEDKEKVILGVPNSSTSNVSIFDIAADLTNIKISGISFDGNKDNTTGNNMGIEINDGTTDILIERCLFENFELAAIYCDGVERINILNNKIENCKTNGISLNSSLATVNKKIIISDNHIISTTDSGSGAGIYFTNTSDLILSSNHFSLNDYDLYGNSGEGALKAIQISSNIFETSENGIVIEKDTNDIYEINITDNVIKSGNNYAMQFTSMYAFNINNNIISGQINGIWFNKCTKGNCVGNNFYGSDTYGVRLHGSQYLTITGNNFYYCDTAAIFLESNGATHSTDNVINGNTIDCNGGDYGYRENDANQNRNIITSNRATGAATANISIQGAASVNANNITT